MGLDLYMENLYILNQMYLMYYDSNLDMKIKLFDTYHCYLDFLKEHSNILL